MAAPVDLATALSSFEEPWSPGTVVVLNDCVLRVAHPTELSR